MDPGQDTNLQRRMAIQRRDIEILYDALTKYYWKGRVLVHASFNYLPRGGVVSDCDRIILKQESYDVSEHSGQRYTLRLSVKTPEHSFLLAQCSGYPDNQATFLIYPDVADTACLVLFYVFTSEQDRKLCSPYSAGSSLLLLNTELSQVMEQGDASAGQVLTQELFSCLPMHTTVFRKLDQTHLHGFLITKTMPPHPSDPHNTHALYWSTTGLQSRVQLTLNVSHATCFRVSPACDRPVDTTTLRRSMSVMIRDPRDLPAPRAPALYLDILPPDRKPHDRDATAYMKSLHNFPTSTSTLDSLYSMFVRDTARIWSALTRYTLGPESDSSQTYITASTLLPYYPPQREGAGPHQLQVPLENRRSFRGRTHNETKEGFPSVLCVNQDTMIVTAKTAPPFQALYFLEFTGSSQVAILFYTLNSVTRRQLVIPSCQEETKNQLKITVSENLAPHLDGEDTEQTIQQMVDKVLPHLVPKQSLGRSLFQMHGTHEQFYLIARPTEHKYYYWKIRSEGSVNMTINSTEAAQFQLNVANS